MTSKVIHPPFSLETAPIVKMSTEAIPDLSASFAPLTPEDVMYLTDVAKFVQYNAKKIIAELAFYGAYFVLASMAFYTILSRPKRTLRSWLLFGALVVTFCMASLQCTTDILYLHTQTQVILINHPETPFLSRLATFDNWEWIEACYVVVIVVTGLGDCSLLYILNDVLAAWRAMSITQHKQTMFRTCLKVLMWFLIFVSFVLWIPAVYFQIKAIRQVSLPQYAVTLATTGSACSIASNLIATALIGEAAYDHRRTSADRPGFTTPKILVLLTESGLLYLLIQITKLGLVSSLKSSVIVFGSLDTATTVFALCSMIVGAMYTPALILIIHYGYSMNTNRSVDHHSAHDSSGTGSLSGSGSRGTRRTPHRRNSGGLVFHKDSNGGSGRMQNTTVGSVDSHSLYPQDNGDKFAESTRRSTGADDSIHLNVMKV